MSSAAAAPLGVTREFPEEGQSLLEGGPRLFWTHDVQVRAEDSMSLHLHAIKPGGRVLSSEAGDRTKSELTRVEGLSTRAPAWI